VKLGVSDSEKTFHMGYVDKIEDSLEHVDKNLQVLVLVPIPFYILHIFGQLISYFHQILLYAIVFFNNSSLLMLFERLLYRFTHPFILSFTLINIIDCYRLFRLIVYLTLIFQ
jgi:hypothetical protein